MKMAAIWLQRRRRHREAVIYTNEMPYTRRATMDFVNNITEVKCRQMFRLTRRGIFQLHEILEPRLQRPTKRHRALETIHQVCTLLKFVGSGCFLNEAGEGLGLEKSTVSRIVQATSDYFAVNAGQYISMPSTEGELQEIRQTFYNTAPLPNVVGAIDGTHVMIKGPHRPFDEAAFVNRKGGHSINCMVVCDHKMRIRAIKADNPGSEHDSSVFNYSRLCGRLDGGDLRGSGILLGDSGYAVRPYLFTPLLNPVSQQEKKYNSHHKKIRCIVERAIGLFKSRFRCLDKSAGCLNFTPGRACRIIIMCAALHNLCINLNEPPFLIDEDYDEDNNISIMVNDDRHDGIEARRRVIETLRL